MGTRLQHGDSLYQVIEKVNEIIDGTVQPGSGGSGGNGSSPSTNVTTSMLEAETDRATGAEQYLQDQIDIINTLIGAGNGDEADSNTGEDNELQAALIMESIHAATREHNNAQDIAGEVARATAAEQALDTAIQDEVTRAQTAEQALDTAIQDEVTRAQTAEGNLSAAITNEVARAQTAEQNLQNEIDNITPVKETYSATLNGQKGSTWVVTAERYNGIVTMLVSYRLGSGQTSTAGETISTADLLPAHWRPGIFQTVMCAMMANQTQYMFSMRFNTNGRIDFINGSSGTSGTWGAISASLTFIAGDI